MVSNVYGGITRSLVSAILCFLALLLVLKSSSVVSQRTTDNEDRRNRDQKRSSMEWENYNYYEILGLQTGRDYTVNDIKQAYKTQAKRWHPDKVTQHNSAEQSSPKVTFEETNARFAKIAQAYQVLSNEEEKEKYDYYLKQQEKQQTTQNSDHSRSSSDLNPMYGDDYISSWLDVLYDPRQLFAEFFHDINSMFAGEVYTQNSEYEERKNRGNFESGNSASHESNYRNNIKFNNMAFHESNNPNNVGSDNSELHEKLNNNHLKNSKPLFHKPFDMAFDVSQDEVEYLDQNYGKVVRVLQKEYYKQNDNKSILNYIWGHDFLKRSDLYWSSWIYEPLHYESFLVKVELVQPDSHKTYAQQKLLESNELYADRVLKSSDLLRNYRYVSTFSDGEIYVFDSFLMSIVWKTDIEIVATIQQLKECELVLHRSQLTLTCPYSSSGARVIWSSNVDTELYEFDEMFSSLPMYYKASLDSDGSLSVYQMQPISSDISELQWLIPKFGTPRLLVRLWHLLLFICLNIQRPSHRDGQYGDVDRSDMKLMMMTRKVCRWTSSPCGCWRLGRFGVRLYREILLVWNHLRRWAGSL